MFDRGSLRRSWDLFVRSLGVIAGERKLLLLPAAGFACVLLMFTLFSIMVLAPVVLSPGEHAWLDLRHWEPLFRRWGDLFSFDPARLKSQVSDADFRRFVNGEGTLARMAVCYLLVMTLPLMGSLLNAAFYNETIRALAGEPVSLRNGLRTAFRRFRALLNWFVFSVLVVGVSRLLVGRFGMAGRIAASLLGMSWAAASFFVIPILLREKRSGEDTPLKALGTSATLVKRTWGETVTGFIGFQILGLPGWVGAGLIYLYFRMSGGFPPTLTGPAIGIGLLLMLPAVIIRAAEDVYRCALYVYATEGVVPEPFTEEQLNAAWKIRTPKHD